MSINLPVSDDRGTDPPQYNPFKLLLQIFIYVHNSDTMRHDHPLFAFHIFVFFAQKKRDERAIDNVNKFKINNSIEIRYLDFNSILTT